MGAKLHLPLVLRQKWTRRLLILPGMMLLGGFGGVLSYMGFVQNEMAALGVGAFFSFMALMLLLSIFRCRLTLGEQGFEFRGPIRTLFVRWEDVQNFVPTRVSIGWNYTPEFRKVTKWRKMNRGMGMEGSIPSQFGGMSPLELGRLMNRLRYRYQSVPEISADQKFALATSAILTEMNGHRHDCLYGDRSSSALVADTCEILKDFWGVGDGVQVTQRLRELKEEGHRGEYEYIRERLEKTDMVSNPLDLLDKEIVSEMSKAERKDFQRKVAFVQGHKAQHSSLLAWDLCRIVSVARFGAAAGYLTDSDAWAWILWAGHELRQAFGSWSAMAANYTVGREYWGATHGAGMFTVAVDSLLDKENPDSPWNRIPWPGAA